MVRRSKANMGGKMKVFVYEKQFRFLNGKKFCRKKAEINGVVLAQQLPDRQFMICTKTGDVMIYDTTIYKVTLYQN